MGDPRELGEIGKKGVLGYGGSRRRGVNGKGAQETRGVRGRGQLGGEDLEEEEY